MALMTSAFCDEMRTRAHRSIFKLIYDLGLQPLHRLHARRGLRVNEHRREKISGRDVIEIDYHKNSGHNPAGLRAFITISRGQTNERSS